MVVMVVIVVTHGSARGCLLFVVVGFGCHSRDSSNLILLVYALIAQWPK